MFKTKLFLLFICCVSANLAAAQQMYKTVGPDGKVTFSDRPQVDDKTKLSVMKVYQLHTLEAPKPRPAESAPVARRAPGAPSPTLTPEIEEAMVTVMGLADFGLRFESFCNASPALAKSFMTANNDWKKRNAAAIDQQRRLLSNVVSPAKRAQLIELQKQSTSDEVVKLKPHSPAERKAWCEGVIAELNSGRSDVDKPAMMAIPIVPYRAK
jgi:hypothetical protein